MDKKKSKEFQVSVKFDAETFKIIEKMALESDRARGYIVRNGFKKWLDSQKMVKKSPS